MEKGYVPSIYVLPDGRMQAEFVMYFTPSQPDPELYEAGRVTDADGKRSGILIYRIVPMIVILDFEHRNIMSVGFEKAYMPKTT